MGSLRCVLILFRGDVGGRPRVVYYYNLIVMRMVILGLMWYYYNLIVMRMMIL